jgi:uncharacterized protein YrrD
MQIKKDAKVLTSDNKDVGRVDRIVIDPSTREITHLVIRQGWLFTEDKVLPISWVSDTVDNNLRLRALSDDLEGLPVFEENYYVSVDEDGLESQQRVADYAAPYLFYPYGLSLGSATYLNDDLGTPQKTARNIPARTVALKEGANVIASDGEHVGDVERVVSQGDSDVASYLVISKGLLFKERKVIPNSWVQEVQEDKVRLVVDSEVVGRLRDYEAPPA